MAKPTHLSGLSFRQAGTAEDYDLGGIIIQGVAAEALTTGDCVFLNSSGKWEKTATIANYAKNAIGIVVGGQDSDYEVDYSAAGGAAASADTEKVLICVYGICKAIAGAALATIGVYVGAGAVVAGRIAAHAEGEQVLGTLLETAAGAASVAKVLVNPFFLGVQEDTTS